MKDNGASNPSHKGRINLSGLSCHLQKVSTNLATCDKLALSETGQGQGLLSYIYIYIEIYESYHYKKVSRKLGINYRIFQGVFSLLIAPSVQKFFGATMPLKDPNSYRSEAIEMHSLVCGPLKHNYIIYHLNHLKLGLWFGCKKLGILPISLSHSHFHKGFQYQSKMQYPTKARRLTFGCEKFTFGYCSYCFRKLDS